MSRLRCDHWSIAWGDGEPTLSSTEAVNGFATITAIATMITISTIKYRLLIAFSQPSRVLKGRADRASSTRRRKMNELYLFMSLAICRW
jgi:hypothetical protein